MTVTVRTRFAPSPTGLLHLGNARTALFAWLAARRAGSAGEFLLRIEDTDLARNQDEATARLLDDLRWLGLGWDGEPVHQSARAGRHAAALDLLVARGQAYPCFCTDAELEAHRALARASGRPPRYAGTCRGLAPDAVASRVAAGRPASLRFAVPARRVIAFDDVVHGAQRVATAEIGDFVVRRRDGTPTFLFANAVDDADQGVTLALRGEDHLANTPRQLLVLEALGLTAPRYGHLPLVHGADGPLSKRDGAVSVADLRDQGWLPLAVVNHLARLGHSGAPEGLLALTDLAAHFDLGHLGRAAARFDIVQLTHFQRLAVLALAPPDFLAWAGVDAVRDLGTRDAAAFVAAVRGNALLPAEVRAWAAALGDATVGTADAEAAIAAAPATLFGAALAASAAPDFDTVAAAAREAAGLKGPALYKPLRAALTGSLAGPELRAWWPLLPPAQRDARLRRAQTLARGPA